MSVRHADARIRSASSEFGGSLSREIGEGPPPGRRTPSPRWCRWRGATVVVAALVLFAGASLASGRSENATVHIVSFGAVHGEIGDCGCKTDPKGGLDLRSGFLDSLFTAEVPLLHLDAGNFFSTQQFGAEKVTRFLWEAMQRMEVDATTPGARELAEWPLYLQFLEEDVIPIVSTNLSFLAEGGEPRPIGQSHIVFERGGVRIGVLGLMGGRQFTKIEIPKGFELRFTDPFTAARKAVVELGDEVDLIVVLSQLPQKDTEALLRVIPEIDVAILGNLPAYNETVQYVGESIIQSTGSKGQYLGELVLTVDPEGTIIDHVANNPMMWDPLPRDPEMGARVEQMEQEVAKLKKAASRRARSGE